MSVARPVCGHFKMSVARPVCGHLQMLQGKHDHHRFHEISFEQVFLMYVCLTTLDDQGRFGYIVNIQFQGLFADISILTELS